MFSLFMKYSEKILIPKIGGIDGCFENFEFEINLLKCEKFYFPDELHIFKTVRYFGDFVLS